MDLRGQGVSHTGPPSLWIWCPAEESRRRLWHPPPSPCSASRRAPRPPVTYHRHGQLQAQGSPADGQGQHSQQADPWGRESQSALSRLG